MYDFPDLGQSPLQLHVGADGTVHLPYAGNVRASGYSPEGFQQAITEALRSKGIVKEPNVSVEIVSAVNMLVQVIGEVRAPKAVPLFAPAPISYVIGEAGGLTGLASKHLTILHHSDQPPTSLDFDPDSSNSTLLNTLVQPGDIINVSTTGVYYIAGEVTKPGIYPISGALSVGQVTNITGFGVAKHLTLLQDAHFAHR
jgi:polysaccharide export outer membrane protein